VRADEGSCPFCDTSLDLASVGAHILPDRRLSRAALLAFGATLAASLSTATACGGDSESGTGGTSGSDAATGGGGSGGAGGGSGGSGGASGGSGGNTGGTAGENTGGTAGENTGGSAGENVGGTAGNVAPPYGIPPDY
jgi:hypothetical protein